MNNRIRQLRKSHGLTQAQFAERLGLGQSTISNFEQNGFKIKEQSIKAICSEFSVNENWLRTGFGDMDIENEKRQKEFFDIFDNLSPILQDHLIKTAKDLLSIQTQLEINSDNIK